MSVLFQKIFGAGPPWLMGVLNVTPDSFSDGGCFLERDAAISRAGELVSGGAHIVDVGGESTGPGRAPVDAGEELRRILPVVEALAQSVFISVDTYKAETADRCLRAGARMINDVSAARADPEMPEVLRRHGCFVVIMHSKETPEHPGASDSVRRCGDIIGEIADFLRERIASLKAAEIEPRRIIADPGLGRFISSDPEDSWEIMRRLSELKEKLAPVPLLVGASRKSFLGGGLEGRDPLSQLCGLAAWLEGADFIRTHDPAMMREFLEAWRRLRPGGSPARGRA